MYDLLSLAENEDEGEFGSKDEELLDIFVGIAIDEMEHYLADKENAEYDSRDDSPLRFVRFHRYIVSMSL